MSTTTDGPKNRRGTLRDEQKRATRAKLVDAARTLFEERGYAAVTVDDIASVVGCSRATFYVHFASKVEMLKTIGAAGMAASAFAFYIDLDRFSTRTLAWNSRLGWSVPSTGSTRTNACCRPGTRPWHSNRSSARQRETV